MKWKKITGVSLIISCFSIFSCKQQLNINQDPNNPSTSQATEQLLFPAATISAASAIGGELAIIGMLWSEYTTEDVSSSQYRNFDSYNVVSTDLNTDYNQLYTGALNDLQLILEKAKSAQDWNYNLMATVMKVYTYQVLVDMYDQVPYTDALQGAADLQPKFDNGDSIYESLLSTLDSALNQDFTASTNTTPGSEDFLFNGDMSQWKAFANTLKLKMYLRMVNVKPTEAEAGINALYSANAEFLTVDAGITQWTTVPNKQNPFYAENIFALNTPSNLKASVTFITWLTKNNDPRIVHILVQRRRLELIRGTTRVIIRFIKRLRLLFSMQLIRFSLFPALNPILCRQKPGRDILEEIRPRHYIMPACRLHLLSMDLMPQVILLPAALMNIRQEEHWMIKSTR